MMEAATENGGPCSSSRWVAIATVFALVLVVMVSAGIMARHTDDGTYVEPTDSSYMDSADYAAMQYCAGQTPGHVDAVQGEVAGSFDSVPPAATALVQCGCADLDGDGVVGDLDVQVFQLLITGP